MKVIEMMRLTSTVLVAMLLSACATKQALLREPDSRPNVTVRIDARPGEFEKFTSDLSTKEDASQKTLRAVLTAQSLQPAADWLPTIVFCVASKNQIDATCLNIGADREGTLLRVKTQEAVSGKSDVITTDLPFALHLTDSHYLDVTFNDRTLRLILNDRMILERPLSTLPDEYWFSCSSIVCTVDINYPFILFPS